MLPDVTAAVGGTPLVALDRLAADVRPRIVAKLEHLNPGGSVKDRIALPMIEAAERAGLLKPGGVIVEPTSGNTGVGLAQAAAVKGYRCIFVMADKQSEEKRALLRAYGAEVVVCPTDVAPDDERSYYRVSDRIAREIARRVEARPVLEPGQSRGPLPHHRAGDLGGDRRSRHALRRGARNGWDRLRDAAATSRSATRRSQVVGADPAGSVYSGDSPQPYLTEGIGEDFWPATYDTGICDVVVRVSDRDSMLTARVATAREGILMGESCGTALWAALQLARDIDDPEALMVVLLPDSGRNYVGKLYSDDWLRSEGLLGADEEVADYDWRTTRADVVLRGDRDPAAAGLMPQALVVGRHPATPLGGVGARLSRRSRRGRLRRSTRRRPPSRPDRRRSGRRTARRLLLALPSIHDTRQTMASQAWLTWRHGSEYRCRSRSSNELEEHMTHVAEPPAAERGDEAGLERVNHWINGARVAGTSGRSGPVYNPATGQGRATGRLRIGRGGRRRRQRSPMRRSRVARHQHQQAHRDPLPHPQPGRAASRGDRGAPDPRARQGQDRCARRGRPRPREPRVRDRHPAPAQGRLQRAGQQRHRRVPDPPAARRGSGHHAIQLPGHGADVDVRQRHRLREHVHPEAVARRTRPHRSISVSC